LASDIDETEIESDEAETKTEPAGEDSIETDLSDRSMDELIADPDAAIRAVIAKTRSWPGGWLKESDVVTPWYELARELAIKKGSDHDEVVDASGVEKTDGAYIDALTFVDALDKLLSVFDVLALPKVCGASISANVLADAASVRAWAEANSESKPTLEDLFLVGTANKDPAYCKKNSETLPSKREARSPEDMIIATKLMWA